MFENLNKEDHEKNLKKIAEREEIERLTKEAMALKDQNEKKQLDKKRVGFGSGDEVVEDQGVIEANNKKREEIEKMVVSQESWEKSGKTDVP